MLQGTAPAKRLTVPHQSGIIREQLIMSTPMGRLAGKIAVVTGGASGVGKGIVLEFARQGAKIVFTDREETADATVEALAGAGIAPENYRFHSADLHDVQACRRVIQHAASEFGGLDILVNCAGDVRRGHIEDTSVEFWDYQMAVNLRAPFILLQESVPHMKARGGGSVVNIGSVNAYIGGRDLLSYSTSKGGLMTFSRNAASYLLRYRIRVNVLNIGWTYTEGEDALQRRTTGDPNWKERVEARRPFKRLLNPQDIAAAALYFASDESALISGSVLDLEQGPINW
jgi:NAD(P)-dependent dehydrogenase (short-subunit alcohol dehydrogenase family)